MSSAWSAGYGLNTTDSRVVLRVPYTAAQVQLLEVGVLLLAQQATRLCKSNHAFLTGSGNYLFCAEIKYILQIPVGDPDGGYCCSMSCR